MKNPWFIFVLARVGVFAAVLATLLILGIDPYFSAMVAAVVGLAVSLLFFQRQRDRVSTSVYEAVTKDKSKPSAENAEDHLLDGEEAKQAQASKS